MFAVGECAEHDGTTYGLVAPLYEQAAVCARAVLGRATTPYRGSVVSTNLKVSGVNLFSGGDFLGDEGTTSQILRDPALPAYKKLVFRPGPDGRTVLAGAVLFGDTADGPWYLDLIKSGTPVDAMRFDMIFGQQFVHRAA